MSGTLSKVFEDASGHLPMFLEFWVQASHDPAIWQTIIEPYRRYQDYFKVMIQQGIADGSLRPVDPGTAGHLLVSLAVGSLLQGVIEPSPETWKNITQQGLNLLIESWRNPP